MRRTGTVLLAAGLLIQLIRLQAARLGRDHVAATGLARPSGVIDSLNAVPLDGLGVFATILGLSLVLRRERPANAVHWLLAMVALALALILV